jgi:hypothetical protein
MEDSLRGALASNWSASMVKGSSVAAMVHAAQL